MAIAFDSSGATAVTVGATSASVDITAAAVGAWCYAWCAISTGATTQTGVPSNAGWSTLQSVQTAAGTSGATYAIFRRQKQSGDTTFSFTWTTSGKGAFVWGSYTGLNSSTPDEQSAIAINDTISRSSIPTPTATPGTASEWAVAFFGQRSTASNQKPGAWTPDAALIERQESDNQAAASSPWLGTDIEDTNGTVTQAAHSYTSVSNRTQSHDGSAILFLIPGAAGPAGTVQPRVTVPVPRRQLARVLWRGGAGQAFAAVPAPAQQPAPAPRRKPARAYVRFAPVTTTNAVPAPPVSGTVQPRATVPVPRRKPSRALARGIAVPAIYGTAPAQQYRTPPRRALSRAVWRGITGQAFVKVPASRQQYRTPPRRVPARAYVRFTPVTTHNVLAPRTLLISLASAAGVDDYGNAFPQGILATAGIIEGPVFEGPDFVINSSGAFFYSGTPAAGNLIGSSLVQSAGTDGFGNNYLAGTASYAATFATALNAGFIAFYAGSLAGGWTQGATILTDSSGDLILTAGGSGSIQLDSAVVFGAGGNTGSGDNGGVTSGPSGTVSAFPAAGPNHTHAEFHTHPL